MIYVRYIDDIFFIWRGTEEDLKKFLAEINEVHPTIKFDHSFSKQTINFLDTKISIIDNRLATAVFTKPTDRSVFACQLLPPQIYERHHSFRSSHQTEKDLH